MIITSNTSVENLFYESVNTLSYLHPGEKFTVKQLFRGFDWKRITTGNRIKLGSMFFNYANNNGSSIIKPLGKTPQNQQQYEKL